MSREVQTLYVAEDEHDIRLDRWFKRRWPHLTHIQVEKMARKGEIRVDGRKIHDMYLFKVKAPDQSKGPWDYYDLVSTIPADKAFRPLADGGCELVK